MRNKIVILLCLTLLLPILNVVNAESNIQISVEGEKLSLNQPPIVVKGTTMVPLRFLSEILGSNITSNGNAISISKKQGNSIYYNSLPLTISGKYIVNKTEDLLEVKIVDLFYNPRTQTVNEIDYFSSIIGFDSGTLKKIQ